MTDEKDTILIRGSEWDRAYVEQSIAGCKTSTWQETKWLPRAALVHRNGGRVSLYVGQGYDPDKIDLVEEGWNHDHCEICWWDLFEADDPEHGIGFSDGQSWLCSECYNKFVAPVGEEEARRERMEMGNWPLRINMNRDDALLIIDVQVGIIEGFHAYRGREVLEQINKLLVNARASNMPILYVQHDGEKGHPLEVGSEGWRIHPEIKPHEKDLIIRKRASDSFFETTLQRELEARGTKHLIVTGCMTEYCVDTTARRAISMGYDVTLVGDAHTTIDNKLLTAAQIIAHHNSLLDGFDAGGHTITVKPADEITF